MAWLKTHGTRLGLLPLLITVGCGSGSSSNGPGPDAGKSKGMSSMIGLPCMRPADPNCGGATPQAIQGTCSSGERCIPETCGGQDNGFPGGYCSQACDSSACPSGSTCVILPDSGVYRCLATCTNDTECRQGYGCQDPAGSGQHVCYPIQPTGGTNGGMACVTPPASLTPAGFTTPNVLVPYGTSDDVFDSEGNVDVDGLGHAAVSFTAVYGAGGSGMAVASYGEGAGFATTPQVFNSTFTAGGFTSDPVVAYDRAASPPRLYLAWIDIQGSSSGPMSDKILVSYSDAGGAPGSWSAPAQVSSDADTAAGFLDKPWIVARNGTVIVTYDLQGNSVHIRVARSSDGGKSWAAPINADMTDAFRNLAQPVLDAAGDLWVAWYESGTSGSQVVVAEQPHGMPAFTSNVVASGSVQPAFDDPTIAVTDDASAMWVTFADNDPGTGSDLWATVSRDGGMTFKAPIKVNDDPDPKAPAPCATHFHGAVAVDAKGRPHVVWYDNRYLQGNVMYATSNDGLTFSANAVVNDAQFPFTTDRSTQTWLGDYLGVTADATKLYVAWADPRSGASRMYFAERSLP